MNAPTDSLQQMAMPDDYWTYTTRCECCGEMIDYVVQKMNAAGTNDGYTHKGFAAYVETMRPQRWLDCEKCGRMTLQTVVAYEQAPDGHSVEMSREADC